MAHDSLLRIKTSDDDSELFSAHDAGKGAIRTNEYNPDTPLLRFFIASNAIQVKQIFQKQEKNFLIKVNSWKTIVFW